MMIRRKQPGVPSITPSCVETSIAAPGFTLIELLIVVAILGILAAIAVPNFLNAQTKAKIGAVKADFRTMGTAADMYMVDWGRYPAWDAIWSLAGPSHGFVALTTPVAYLHSHEDAKDKFAMASKRNEAGIKANYDQYYEFAFGDDFGGAWTSAPNGIPQTARNRNRYLIESVGPDGNDSIYTYIYPQVPPDWIPYHTSNGLQSTGDLYRVGGELPQWLKTIESP